MAEVSKNGTAYLFLWEGLFLYAGSSIATNTHEHHALQIIVSKDKPFRMRVLNNDWKEYRSLIINSDQPHECVLESGQVYFLGIEPESVAAISIKKNYLNGADYLSIPQELTNDFIIKLEHQLKTELNCNAIFTVTNSFINSLADSSAHIKQIDERIEKVILVIKDSLSKSIKLKDLSEQVHLSETRLVHLFKEQTGIPIRKFILWNKINLAVKENLTGKNLTEAAHSAGFSDAAHFSRTFKRMFGISAAALLKNSQNIQAFVCSN